MGAFDDVTLQWRGRDYVIPANRMMGAIARIEDHVTMVELGRMGERGTVPLAKLAGAYAAVLRYAGAAKITDEDVYEALFDGGQQATVMAAITALLGMMVPKSARVSAAVEQDTGNSQPDDAKSSGRRSNSRAAGRRRRDGAPLRSSGG